MDTKRQLEIAYSVLESMHNEMGTERFMWRLKELAEEDDSRFSEPEMFRFFKVYSKSTNGKGTKKVKWPQRMKCVKGEHPCIPRKMPARFCTGCGG